MSGENFSSISVANMNLVQPVGGEWKWQMGGWGYRYRYIKPVAFRVHENLVQHPSNDIFIEIANLYIKTSTCMSWAMDSLSDKISCRDFVPKTFLKYNTNDCVQL